MKRFLIGFAVGVGLMYYYLHYAEIMTSRGRGWIEGAAGEYRGDKQHEAARNVLGDDERRP